MTNIKTIAALAASLVAASAFAAADAPETKCGAGSCGKKTSTAKKAADGKDASCSKKGAADGEKEASCSKKPASAPKDASCSKKDAACAKK